jgi:hypothetical protein
MTVTINGTSGVTLGANSTVTFGDSSTLPSATFSPVYPITASAAASALTVTLNPCSLAFRSSTLTSGSTVTRTVASAISVVVPSTATLGTVSATQSRIIVLAIDNAGTVELAVVNISGGTDLTETGLVTTTAISSGSTSASTVYSTTARTSVAYRVVGYVESTQATAGTWATSPSTIQGYGGQALSAMSSVGYSQTWQAFTFGTNRISGTTYYNTTGRPIQILINGSGVSGTFFVNGIKLGTWSGVAETAQSAIVPPGGSYVATAASLLQWSELR